jgi:hypothetical protein
VNKLKRLLKSYSQFIEIPWRSDAAAAQRVIFCVYDEADELQLRYRLDEFELATKQAGHDWACFDLTDSFPAWMSKEDYANSYFEEPELLKDLLPEEYLEYIEKNFDDWSAKNPLTDATVVAIQGVGSLFGFAKIKDCIDRLAPKVSGRLVVFFPGSYENNNYRLLDGYDGWNYLAVPITADKAI